jgi:hypothetical protein
MSIFMKEFHKDKVSFLVPTMKSPNGDNKI